VSFARERLKQPRLMLLQDLILDLDRDETKIMIENIEELCGEGTAVINTSCVFKNALMLGQRTYRLDSAGLTELFGSGEETNGSKAYQEENKTYKIEKIPAKIDERILLFDPNEIDYIESEQGVSCLYIRWEKFPCMVPLSDLEERIRCFGFFRSHRSYLVNLQRVREVVTWTRNSYSLNLDDKAKSSIPLSKGRLEDLKAILNF
jgi:ABC-2 type transport system ATP-binding protein